MQYLKQKYKDMTNQDLIDIGFAIIPHFTIGDTVIYNLGRNRHLSVSSVGTPNEILFICATDYKDQKKITDLVCLHNYDYDKLLTIEKVQNIIKALT